MSRRVEELRLPGPGKHPRLTEPLRCAVVGGGIAGVAAATVLVERGAEVTLFEREAYLGGRAGAWSDRLADGTDFEMERGFHAFFRQYYNLRALLRRIDPELSFLAPLDDYPILGPEGQVESFRGLPRRAPWNVLALTWRTPTMKLWDLLRVNGRAALQMLRYDEERTFESYDGKSAREYLDSLSFPPRARRMLFDVFSHSFFNPEEGMSAGELLRMFHFYFVGNPEGLVFDVAARPFSTCIWKPFERWLAERGVDLRLGAAVSSIQTGLDARWRLTLDPGSEEFDAVVLATETAGLQSIVARSPHLDDVEWRARVDSLDRTLPFAVWRLWLDREVDEERAPFAGTTGVGILDNISIYERLEDESRAWSERAGGSVVELHAYGVPEHFSEDEVRGNLLEGLHTFYPETREARVVEDRFGMRRDCPSFGVGSHALRPGVETPFEDLVLAGDFVKLPIPSALMERAAAAGLLAANHLLVPRDVQPEVVRSIPPRGIFAFSRRRGADAPARLSGQPA